MISARFQHSEARPRYAETLIKNSRIPLWRSGWRRFNLLLLNDLIPRRAMLTGLEDPATPAGIVECDVLTAARGPASWATSLGNQLVGLLGDAVPVGHHRGMVNRNLPQPWRRQALARAQPRRNPEINLITRLARGLNSAVASSKSTATNNQSER